MQSNRLPVFYLQLEKTSVKQLINTLPKLPFLPECLLYLGFHLSFLDKYLKSLEKNKHEKKSKINLKNSTMISLLREEINTYYTLYKQIRVQRYEDALRSLHVIDNRENTLRHIEYSLKEKYRHTNLKELKYVGQAYGEVANILVKMYVHVEEEFCK